MENLDIVEMKTFVPAKDFEKSKSFYQAVGFALASEFDGIACFKKGSYSFLLQDFYEPAHCHHFMMHLLVQDVDSWYKHIMASQVTTLFEVTISELINQPWAMKEFCLTDPSGVLWRIAENT